MHKSIRTVVLAGALTLMTAAAANATTGPAMIMSDGTPGTASNTAAVSGNASNFGNHTFTVGGVTVTCPDANYGISSLTTTVALVTPDYTGCSLLVSGTPVAAAGIDTPCGWDLSFANATFNTTTSSTTGGTVTTTCATTVTVEAIGCTLHVPAQTREGISANNINQAGNHDTSATPWGSRIIASVTGLTYTATGSCPGIPEHGTGNYVGTVAVRGVTGSL